jgi:hypothetical protein
MQMRLSSLEGREDVIDWVYKATYGQRRPIRSGQSRAEGTASRGDSV